MYNKKWKKLSKRFACALALAMLMSVNPAWAKVEVDNANNTLTIIDETVTSDTHPPDGQEYSLSSYENVVIKMENTTAQTTDGPIELWGNKFDIPNTNLTIKLNGNGSNLDGFHVAANGTYSTQDFYAEISTKNSDAINMSHDVYNGDATVTVNGNLTATVYNGNGIRANGSRNGEYTSTLTVEGDTNITLNAGSISQNVTYLGIPATGTYHTAAVYAGNSASKLIGGKETRGKGEINLQGDTKTTLKGNGSYGIYAGKNGSINVNNNLTITSEGKGGYGVAARDLNLIYGEMSMEFDDPRWGAIFENFFPGGNVDQAENKFGSTVVLSGEENNITMGEGGKALYASGVDAKDNSISIRSGANGIGYLNAKGAITAEDEGTINLKLRDFLKVEGTLSALDGGVVSIAYGQNTDGHSNQITGDLVADGGTMSITGTNAMKLDGGAFAANGGELTLSLGSGSVWAGRVDDYQDAANENWAAKHKEIFKTPITSINKDGDVTVSLASGAKWNVTGQSWVSKLDGNGIIDLRGSETGGYAIHIGELAGSNTFYLNLYNGDKIGDGDMIYIAKEVTAPQKIVIANRDEVLSSMNAGDRIRFATIGGEVGFSEGAASTQPAAAFGRSTRIKDAGMLNVDFSIDYLDYNHADNDDENHDAYHGGQEMQEDKPGAKYVDSIYGTNENSQNVYITRLESTENPTEEPKLSDAGRTVLNMSRANYAAAVYMDRLNKRMGEARYFAGQDEGIWARIRHDRVGRDDAFLVQNTMFEVGYDRKIASKTGTRRVGIAADYMEGDTEYNNIAGEGEIDRFGLWLYSTWLGEKGHYTDYVLKWGRMSNEFDIYGMSTGERITGDYDNNVFSASAEYGRKIELGKGWFFEPQAQVQFARITDADYVTSQGTRVEVDGVNSLIARAGFRLGREFGGKNQGSVYVKADVLHEFLGDQDVHALDGTTDSRWYTVGYDNDGTWYDVGLGLSCRTGKNSFVFLDLEHSFGNDNDDSYQISAGVQWSF